MQAATSKINSDIKCTVLSQHLGIRVRISRISWNDNFDCSGLNGNDSHGNATQPTQTKQMKSYVIDQVIQMLQ